MDPRVQLADWAKLRQKNPQFLLNEIQGSIIASPTIANPCFGKKKSIYTDFFASSKPLMKFESIMTETVLPFYANTHTSTTSTSKSTSTSVKLARETIRRCTNAVATPGHEHQAANDTVAISELLHKYGAFAFYDYAGVGPYTTVDMNPPPSASSTPGEKNLAYKDGVFISTHKFLGGPGASGVLVARLKVFDWIDQHSATERNEYIPATPGGGTVDMVLQGRHKYTHNVLAREEAGTPNILATIRTGLVFQLQEIVNPEWILQKEYKLAKTVLARLTAPTLAQSVHVLGSAEQDRVAVFSLTIAVPKFLSRDQKQPLQIHYALLSTIMNDFFGVEMRGGCMCAGPYASQLLKFDAEKEDAFWRLLLGGDAGFNDAVRPNIHKQDLYSKSLKPGFVRFSFSYFARKKDVEFVVQSLEWVAQYGYLLIPIYKLDAKSGEWSVREAVRKAVSNEILGSRRTSGLRKHCIPAAIDCIYGLQKLFREQANPTWPRASPPTQSPYLVPDATANLQRRCNSSGEMDGGRHGSKVLASLSKAKWSLTDLFTATLQKPGGDHRTETTARSRQQHSDGEETGVNKHHISGLYKPDINSLPADTPVTPRCHSASSLSTISDTPTANTTVKKPSIFSAARHLSAKERRLLADALEELEWGKLQAEVEAIETSELAKNLRWFVTPLEVAKLYTQELVNPSATSPFPKRIR
ncbi:hypothetical protein BGZ58_010392 [Dissophora ornata]|nr:hypothetical protein BGZ58_010392 [Dissophora ornata]